MKSRDLSIISNDCWGGMAYQELATPYCSPFAGLFVVPDDYLRLLSDLRPVLTAPIQFRNVSVHGDINAWRDQIQRRYPIGVLPNDVEIQFLHYGSEDEARAKWTRRVERINWEKLRLKMSWHDHPQMDQLLRQFDALPFEGKVCFAPTAIAGIRSCVPLHDFSTDGTQQYWRAHKAFDVAAFLDRGVIQRGAMTMLNWLFYYRY